MTWKVSKDWRRFCRSRFSQTVAQRRALAEQRDFLFGGMSSYKLDLKPVWRAVLTSDDLETVKDFAKRGPLFIDR